MTLGLDLLCIDHHDSFTHNVVDWLQQGGFRVQTISYDNSNLNYEVTRSNRALVLGPGPNSPSEVSISEKITRQYIGQRPILGICLGHQIMANVAGYKVIKMPSPWHGHKKVISVTQPKGIFENVPLRFKAASYNSLGVNLEKNREHWEVTAVNGDSSLTEVQAIAYCGPGAPAFGIQFHPESFMTEHGDLICHNWRQTVQKWASNNN